MSAHPDLSGRLTASRWDATSEDALELTTYFGERGRVGSRLLADQLLDIHARHRVRASILLRGAQGFGAKHGRRTDRLLTLSEDLPLVAVAVDGRERIEALLRDIEASGQAGLTTLGAAQTGLTALGAAQPGLTALRDAQLRSMEMKPAQLSSRSDNAVKLTLYLGRHERSKGSPAFVAACEALHESGVAGATVLLGVDGTRHGLRQRARFFARNANVPLIVISVGEAEQIDDALAHLKQILDKPLFTIEHVRVCKRDGALLRTPHHPSVGGGQGAELRQKLTVITSEAATHENNSVYLALVRRLRSAGAAGATSLRGIWGFHGNHQPHGDRLLSIRRHVPVVTVVIDTPERIAELFPIIDDLTHERGLVTSELVRVSSAPPPAPGL